MYIKQYEVFNLKKDFNNYYSISTVFQAKTSYVERFLQDAYVYVRRQGVSSFLDDLFQPDGEGEMRLELVVLTVDKDLDLVYLHEDYWDFIKTITDSKLQLFYEELSDIELCREKIMDCAVMSKNNFIHLLTAWDQLWNQKPPFILLYQDNTDWYDLVSFNSQEEMEQFVEKHTQAPS